MKKFIKLKNKHFKKLEVFVPIVNRVHGDTHPEFKDVKVEFDQIVAKFNNKDYEIIDHFNNLKTITNNYQIPNDVCETYELVYAMLKELDSLYRSESL